MINLKLNSNQKRSLKELLKNIDLVSNHLSLWLNQTARPTLDKALKHCQNVIKDNNLPTNPSLLLSNVKYEYQVFKNEGGATSHHYNDRFQGFIAPSISILDFYLHLPQLKNFKIVNHPHLTKGMIVLYDLETPSEIHLGNISN